MNAIFTATEYVILRGALLLACLVVCAHSSARAETACSPKTLYEPPLCETGLPKIKALIVDQNSKRDHLSVNPDGDCSFFSVTEDLVLDFFERSRLVRDNEIGYLLEWSSCYADGTMEFENGSTAYWRVYQFRLASLLFENDKKMWYYCDDCKVNDVPIQ